jgi:hypothetical protein
MPQQFIPYAFGWMFKKEQPDRSPWEVKKILSFSLSLPNWRLRRTNGVAASVSFLVLLCFFLFPQKRLTKWQKFDRNR